MTVWRSTNVDWSAGDGLKVLQLFQRAYPDPLKLQASAMRAGVAPADLTDASHERTLSKAAEQSRLLAMAAVLLHDTSRAVFHIRLREVLGDELPAAQAEWYIMYGTPTDQQEGEQLLNPQVVDALLQHDGFESFNAPHAASGSADAHARVHDEARNRVAMIRLNGHPVATGFLVGPDLLLTAAHAIGLRPWPPTSVSGLVAVFDYRSGAASAGQAGMPIQVADFLEGSLPADDEGIAGAPQPAIPSDRLDFALLRLERQIGVGQGLGGVSRGWYCLDATNYSFANATLLLLWGHPSGMELQHTYTVGTITSNPNGPRVRYTTNTERGSSGCPVVEPSGRLVAMHHFSVKGNLGNQAVPIAPITAQLLNGKFAAELNQPVPLAMGGPTAPLGQSATAIGINEPDPFAAAEIGGRPMIDREPLRSTYWDLVRGKGPRTLRITGGVDSGISTSFDILDHAADRAHIHPVLRQLAPEGLRAIRIDLRAYTRVPAEKRARGLINEIFRWVEGNKPSEKRVAQVAKEISNFRMWARNAFATPGTQWWIFVDSIDTTTDISRHGVGEVLGVLLELARSAQLGLRVVLAGRRPNAVEHPAGTWPLDDVAKGLQRPDVQRWFEMGSQTRQRTLPTEKLTAELDRLFPQEEPLDPTDLQREIAQTAKRLWS